MTALSLRLHAVKKRCTLNQFETLSMQAVGREAPRGAAQLES